MPPLSIDVPQYVVLDPVTTSRNNFPVRMTMRSDQIIKKFCLSVIQVFGWESDPKTKKECLLYE